jgi:hypothetical protein
MRACIVNRWIAFFLLFILIYSPLTPALASMGLLGEVTPHGNAKVKSANGRWYAVENVHPLFSQTAFRTEKGRLSFMLNDGTKLEVGNDSEIFIIGDSGNYEVNLLKGGIAFKIYPGSSIAVKTPDSLIEVPYNAEGSHIKKVAASDEQIIGAVLYDGSKTQVISVVGDIKVRSLVDNSNIIKLTSGKMVTSESGNYRVVPIQATVEGEEESSSVFKTWHYALAAAVILFPAIVFIVEDNRTDNLDERVDVLERLHSPWFFPQN